jgi:hypothetical protein
MTVRSLLFALLPASILLHSGIAGAWDDTVVTTFAGHQGDPAVAVSDSGTSVIVWYGSGEGDTLGIFGRRFAADGTPMGGEFRVNTVTVEEQDDCAVAMNGSGAFVVVWESDLQDGDEEGIFARRYDASGTPLDLVEIQVSTVSTDRQLDPNVAMADDGRFVVVWEAFPNFDGSAGAVYARLFGADGIPTTGNILVNSTTFDGQRDPVVAMWPDGGFAVAWESASQDFETTWGIIARVFDDTGAATTAEIDVNTYVEGDQRDPFVAAAHSGGFSVVWTSSGQDGDDGGVYLRSFDRLGQPESAEVRVNTTTEGWQGDPCVGADGNGSVLVVFEDGDEPQDSLIREFSTDGTPIGDPVRVHLDPLADHDDPELAVNRLGFAVVAWERYQQDPTGDDVLARSWSTTAPIFSDDFESGLLDAWSSHTSPR